MAASEGKGTAPADDAAEVDIFSVLNLLRSGIVVGQGSGRKRPLGSRRPSSTATKMRRSPWAKQLCSRGRERLVAVRRAICNSGNASNPLHGCVASASPPTLTTQKVATAIANHKRLARAASVILVWCHCHPPRLVSLKPPSIQVRILYHTTLAASGARSVSTSHGSA